jgi:hypothetical protein
MDSLRARKIVAWLRRVPVPYQIRCEHDAKEDKTIQVIPEQGKPKWTDICEAALAYDHLVALDKNGNVTRELPLDPEDPDIRKQAVIDSQVAQSKAAAALPGREPIISIDVPKLVEAIASNMKDVAKESASMQANAFQGGFEAMVSVVNLCLGLLTRMDRRLEDVEDAHAELQDNRDAITVPGEAPEDRNQLAIAAMLQHLGAKGGGSNGKADDGVDPVLALKLGELLKQYMPGSQPPEAE